MRRLDRKERKAAFNQFVEAVTKALNLELKPEISYKDKFKTVWPIIKPALEFAIILKITGDKFDASTKKIISIGDNMIGQEITDAEALDFMEKLESVWEIIEMVFEIMKIFVSDKVDEIIDKVIEIGEWMFETPQ